VGLYTEGLILGRAYIRNSTVFSLTQVHETILD
jgi:hypothetical protein